MRLSLRTVRAGILGILLANRWLFGPALRYGFSREPALDAMLRLKEAFPLDSPVAGIKPVSILEGDKMYFELDFATIVGH